MRFFKQKLSGIQKRLKCLSFGFFYFRNSAFVIPRHFFINGRFRELKFLDSTADTFIYEFNEICLEDCYNLRRLKNELPAVKAIVDIGANQGLFSIAARKYFSKALVHCYEPNKNLEPYLQFNADALGAKTYFEAVTKEDSKIKLDFGHTDLHTISRESDEGDVTGIAFRKVIDKAGGKIDILKLDCEGAEWALFDDKESWKNINSISMEYHLWAKPGSSVSQIISILSELGFSILDHKPLSDKFGLLTLTRK